MMSLAGASRAVVPAPDDFAALPTAAEAAGAARADELAEPEHPARNSPPASMTPPMASAAPARVRTVRTGRRFRLKVFSMRV